MAKRDYYEVLGLARSASTDDVKSAYRRLARQYHPDVNAGDTKVAEERFKEVSEAYEVLADPEKRKRYDQMGFAGIETEFGPQGFTWQNFTHVGDIQDLFGGSDFFQQLFEQGFLGGAAAGARGRVPGRGSDIEVSVRLPLSAAVTGAEPTIEVPNQTRCEDCKGTGARNGTALETCPECEGRGQVRRSQARGFSQLITISECPMCRGSGRRIKEVCDTCHGTGALRRTKKIQVTIPPGVDDGAVLRVPRQGIPSNAGGPSGDLFVQVAYESDGSIRREGTDGYADADLPLVDALFGGELRVATVTGQALLKIPPGTQPEAQFRLRGEGFPRLRGRERGDLIVTVHVTLPKSLSSHQKELLKEALGAPAAAAKNGRRSGLFGRRG